MSWCKWNGCVWIEVEQGTGVGGREGKNGGCLSLIPPRRCWWYLTRILSSCSYDARNFPPSNDWETFVRHRILSFLPRQCNSGTVRYVFTSRDLVRVATSPYHFYDKLQSTASTAIWSLPRFLWNKYIGQSYEMDFIPSQGFISFLFHFYLISISFLFHSTSISFLSHFFHLYFICISFL